MLKYGMSAQITKSAVPVLPIFNIIQREGNISEHDMFNTFNMGVGMVIAIDKNDVDKALNVLAQTGENAFVLGEVVKGDKEVIFV